jgi:MFS family permease
MTLLAPLLASFSIFYVAIIEDLRWSRADTALALSVYFSVSGLASPFAGRLIDKFGPRIVMPAGALVTAGAFFWISRMTSLWHFYVAFGIIAAIGATMLNVVPMTTIISNWFVRRRGLAIGLVIAGQGMGQAGIPLIQYLIDHIGWRSSYLVLGGIILVVPTTLILLFLYNRPEDRGLTTEDEASPLRKDNSGDTLIEEPTDKNAKLRREVVVVDQKWVETEWTIGKAIRTMRFWAFTLGMALLSAGFVIISVQLVAYLKDKGYSSALAASAVGFEGLVNIACKFLGGALSDRIGREQTVTLGVLLLLTCVLLLVASGMVLSPVLVYAFAICYGIGFGMTLPALMAAGADLFQGKNLGSILGVAWFGGYLGGALGAWMSGFFVDVTGGYTLNFLVTGTVILVSGALFWKARPSQVRVLRTVSVA